MNIITAIKSKFFALPLWGKFAVLLVVAALLFIVLSRLTSKKSSSTQYQTATAQRGTLVVSVTGSGQVSTANNGVIDTQASGVVSKLYVKDGDEVKTGDKIADIDLDLPGQQNAAQAYAAYQTAKNNLVTAQNGLYTTQSDMFTQWQSYFNTATNSTYQNSDGSPNDTNRALPEFHILQDNWLASESKYKNQQNVVAQAQSSLNSAWLTYQHSSSTIYAPISGVVTGLSLQPGSVIASTASSSSNSTQSSTKIASIKTKAMPTVTINLTEIDVPTIALDDRATVTFDAFPDKTFTGKVISIDTAGVVSSGVTTYPTVIRLDTDSNQILPNMAASASIITQTKDEALTVPTSSVQKQNTASYVLVLKNGIPQQTTVETGLSSSTDTEILSGLSVGDTVVTNTIALNAQSNSQTTSPFSAFGGARGGAVRFGR